MKVTERWFSSRLQQDIGIARWGHYGVPVLVFPTAGGDAEEIERHHLVSACAELIDSGRVKLYSCDSVAGRAMVSKIGPPSYRLALLNRFHDCIRHEVVPAIYTDLDREQPIIATGASIGAFNALAMVCRFPDVFGTAIGMSGTYRVERFFDGRVHRRPLLFLAGSLPPRPRRSVAGHVATALRHPGFRAGRVGGRRRVLACGEHPRGEGHPESG